MDSVTMTEQQIRADERRRLAALIRENAETIGDFAGSKVLAVQLVAHLLREHMAVTPEIATVSRQVRSR